MDSCCILRVRGSVMHSKSSSDGSTSIARERISGPWKMVSLAIAISSLMVAAAHGGAGRWTTSGPGPFLEAITAIQIDPGDSRIIYVAAGTRTLWRSTNGGGEWQTFESETTHLETLKTVLHRTGFLYGAGRAVNSSQKMNVVLSTDYGATWLPRGSFNPLPSHMVVTLRDLVISPGEPNVLYLAAGYFGNFKTTDGGLNWRSLAGSPADFQCVAVDHFDSGLVYGGTAGSFWRSTDGGETWAEMGGGLPRHARVESLATDPFTPGVVYAGTAGGGIYKSTDGGDSWKSIPAPVANAHVPVIVPHGASAGAVDVLSQGTESGGLYRSLDSGTNWARLELPASPTSALAISAADLSTIYLGTSDHGLAKTTNGGKSWQLIDPGLDSSFWLAGISRGAEGDLYTWTAGGRTNQVFRSTDSAQSWTSLPSVTRLLRIYASPLVPGFAAALLEPGDGSTLMLTRDGGLNWQRVHGPSDYITHIVFDATQPERLYMVSYVGSGNVMLRSDDGGLTWSPPSGSPLPAEIHTLAQDPSRPDTLLAATREGIWKSDDAGVTWSRVCPRLQVCDVGFLEVSPQDSNVILLAYPGCEASRSDDGGRTWKSLDLGLPAGWEVSALSFQASSGHAYLSAWNYSGEGRVMLSTDAGVSWVPVAEGGARYPADLLVSPGPATTLWTLDPFHGVFAYTFEGTRASSARARRGEPRRSLGSAHSGLVMMSWPSKEVGPISRWDPARPSGDGRHFAANLSSRQLDSFSTTGTSFESSAIAPTEPWLQAAATPSFPPVVWQKSGPAVCPDGQVVVDPFNPRVVYFGPTREFEAYSAKRYRSVDGGESWETWDSQGGWGLSFGARPGLLYRLETGLGLMKSADSGKSWQALGVKDVLGAVPDPGDPKIIWALRNQVIDKSTDGGASWRTLAPRTLQRLVIDPGATNIMYAAQTAPPPSTGDPVTVRTTDGGKTWSVIGIRGPEDILVDPERPGYVYFADPHYGILKSTDNGWSWVPANEGLPCPEARRLAYDAVQGVLYCGVPASSKGSVFKSTDAAASWQPTNPSLKETIRSLAVVEPGWLLAGVASGVYRSSNAGATWHRSEEGLPMPAVNDVLVTPAAPDVIYINTGGGLFRSEDAGTRWVPINFELDPGDYVVALATAPTDESLLLAATSTSVYLSRDRGDNWKEVLQTTMGWRPSVHLAVAPDDPNTFYFSWAGGSGPMPSTDSYSAMYRTRDGGQTWVPLPIDEHAWVSEPVIGPRGRLFIFQDGKLCRSTDYGNTWTATVDFRFYPWRLVGSPSNTSVLYAAFLLYDDTILQSRDSGETWAPVAQLPEYWNDQGGPGMIVDPLDSDRLYIMAGSLFMVSAGSGSFRLLGSEAIDWPQMAIMPGRRVLLVAPGRPGEGLYATVIPPV
ncbi:MAG: hypothetical protein EHM23_19210, partial [Acidobacteria bacterium]